MLSFMAGTAIFSLVSFFMPPVYTAAALSSNAVPACAHKKVVEANGKQKEIDNELENWWLFENDYDLGDILEGSDSLPGFENNNEIVESYENTLSYLEEIHSELEEIMVEVGNENFLDDETLALQTLRLEEDDFGFYEFQINVYLDEEEIGAYHGITEDEEIIEELKQDGRNAEENRVMLGEYFDLPNPFGIRYRKPEHL